MNANQFWADLWAIAKDEALSADQRQPIEAVILQVVEEIARRVESDGGNWYRVSGGPFEPPDDSRVIRDVFVLGAYLGNFLAWQNAVKLFDRGPGH